MKSRLEKAKQELARVQGIADAYELINRWYNSEFCDNAKDENGDYITDEEGNLLYKEKGDNPDDLCNYPWYDGNRFIQARQAMRDVLKYMETMK